MDYWKKTFRCPFFRYDEKQILGCEGGRIKFPDAATAKRFMDEYCAHPSNGWKDCCIAACLLKFYETQEE